MLALIVGFWTCFFKFVPNLLTPGSALRKDLKTLPVIWKLMNKNPRIIDAWLRVCTPGRYFHDATNWIIEVFRFFVQTYEVENPEASRVMSFIVKGICFSIGLNLIFIIGLTCSIIFLLLS